MGLAWPGSRSVGPQGQWLQIDHLDAETTAVIVIDMQNDFIASGAPMETPMGRELLPTLAKLLGHARATGMTVIYTTHAHRANGCDM